jgi:hypothetical protein
VSLSKEVCWCVGRSSLFALRLEIFFTLSDHFRYSSVTLALSSSNFSGSASRAFCRQSDQTCVWQYSGQLLQSAGSGAEALRNNMMEQWYQRIRAAVFSRGGNRMEDRSAPATRPPPTTTTATADPSTNDHRSDTTSNIATIAAPPPPPRRRIQKYRVLPGYLWNSTSSSSKDSLTSRPLVVPPEPTTPPPPSLATVSLLVKTISPPAVSKHAVTTTTTTSSCAAKTLCRGWVHRHWTLARDNDDDGPGWYEKTVSYNTKASIRVRLWDGDQNVNVMVPPANGNKRGTNSWTSALEEEAASSFDRMVLCLSLCGTLTNEESAWTATVSEQLCRFKAMATTTTQLPPLVLLLIVPATVTSMYRNAECTDEPILLRMEHFLKELCRTEQIVAGYAISMEEDDSCHLDGCFRAIVESVLADQAAVAAAAATDYQDAQPQNVSAVLVSETPGPTTNRCPMDATTAAAASSSLDESGAQMQQLLERRRGKRQQPPQPNPVWTTVVKKPKHNHPPAKVTPTVAR